LRAHGAGRKRYEGRRMLRQVATALTTGGRWNSLLGSEAICGRSRQVVTEDGDPYTVVFGEDPMRWLAAQGGYPCSIERPQGGRDLLSIGEASVSEGPPIERRQIPVRSLLGRSTSSVTAGACSAFVVGTNKASRSASTALICSIRSPSRSSSRPI
jgi:hypothetical protein